MRGLVRKKRSQLVLLPQYDNALDNGNGGWPRIVFIAGVSEETLSGSLCGGTAFVSITCM